MRVSAFGRTEQEAAKTLSNKLEGVATCARKNRVKIVIQRKKCGYILFSRNHQTDCTSNFGTQQLTRILTRFNPPSSTSVQSMDRKKDTHSLKQPCSPVSLLSTVLFAGQLVAYKPRSSSLRSCTIFGGGIGAEFPICPSIKGKCQISPLASRMMMTFCGYTRMTRLSQTLAALEHGSAIPNPGRIGSGVCCVAQISNEPLVSPAGLVLTSPRSYVRCAQPLGRRCLSSESTSECSSCVTFLSPSSGRTPNRSRLVTIERLLTYENCFKI